MKEIQQLPAILQHSKDIFTLYIQALLTFSGTTNLIIEPQKPLFSKQAAAPTKLGEFLASGVPCLTNEGVGDMASIINEGRVGKTVNQFTDAAITKGILELIELTQQDDIITRCNNTARSHFSLKDGIDSYFKIYNNL